VKVAALDPRGQLRHVEQRPCPLWRGLAYLEEIIGGVVAEVGTDARRHAVTMTGELVDLFSDRGEGVRSILRVMGQRAGSVPIDVYGADGVFLTVEDAACTPGQVASANWMASASFAARRLGSGLFVDIGSTTSDVITFREGAVAARGANDHERLRYDELVYTGVVRTPLMAIGKSVPFGGDWVGVMAEHFATASDIHRLIGALPPHADQGDTADGADKSMPASARRLARTIGLDVDAGDSRAWSRLAEYLVELQRQRLRQSCERQLSRGLLADGAPLVGAGVGRYLVREIAARMGRPYVDTASWWEAPGGLSFDAADCLPAVAVAALALDRQQARARTE